MPRARDQEGNIWEVDAQGNPVRLLEAAQSQGGIYTLPTSPKDAVSIAGGNLNNTGQAIDNQINQRTIDAQVRKANADAAKAEIEARNATNPTPAQLAMRARVGQMNSLIDQINRVQELYNTGPGTTKGFAGIQDYLPADANSQFDTASAKLSELGLGAFRIPGSGEISNRDAVMFERANMPTAGTRDISIEEILRGLRNRVDNELQTLGQPGANWQGLPEQNKRDSSVPPGTPPGGNGPTMGLSRGENFTSQQDLAVAAAVNAAFRAGGNVTDLVKAAQDAGGQVTPQDIGNFNAAVEARNKGQAVNFEPTSTGKRTAMQQAAGAAMLNPFGTAVADATNMAGMGALEGLMPDQFGAIRNVNPNASAVGQIGGAIAGTSAIGAAARKGLGAVAPNLATRLTGGGAGAQFARNLATDTAYGAAYGGATQGDPLQGAVMAALGSAGGQGASKLIGRGLSGVARSPAAQALKDAGIPLTTGQNFGGMLKGVEDRMAGLPFVGDMVNARRLEGMRAFNERAMNDAVAPINGAASGIGNDGVEALKRQASDAYVRATQGVTVNVDNTLTGEINNIVNNSGLPPDFQARLSQALKNRIEPAIAGGQMSGYEYQQAVRGLKAYRKNASQAAPGFEQDYKNALGSAIESLTNQMRRGGGARVAEDLTKADAAYRNIKTVEKATTAARNGTGTGELQVFTPAQLNNAATQAAQRFPGPRPFADLIDNAQTVLPSRVPDSGTAGRLATYALPTALGGSAAGLDTLGGTDGYATASGLALAAALMAGGTKTGQKAIEKLITSRPDLVRNAGTLVRKKSGLFGTMAVPPLLARPNQ